MRFYLLTLFLLSPHLFANSLPELEDKQLSSALSERGSGEYRRFGFHIYDIKMWAKTHTHQPPYALQITYFMNIKASRIVDASISEMRNLELGVNESRLKIWEKQLSDVFPNVKDQDTITGVHLGNSAEFYLNDSLLGRLEDKQLVDSFFAIWLSEKTSRPKLRKKLMQIESS